MRRSPVRRPCRRRATALLVVGALSITAVTGATADADADAEASLHAILAMPHRSEASRARDAARHPAQTLAFFGLEAGQRVVELWPELGWYAEILAPWARRTGGSYRAVIWIPPGHRAPAWVERSAVVLNVRVAAESREFAGMELAGYRTAMDAPLAPETLTRIAASGSADLVLSFRDAHAWLAGGFLDEMFEAAFDALPPGGIFGIVAHRAPDDWPVTRMVAHGYVSEALLIARAQATGFVVDGTSEINANPADSRDHPAGVWSLPPILRLGETDESRYAAIGEPDRLTLRLRKP
jgi:predicted methyltransferase